MHRLFLSSLLVASVGLVFATTPVENLEIDWAVVKPKHVLVPSTGLPEGVVPHITGGRTATRGQFPWQVAMFMDKRSFCGGSLISPSLVLTAAHCTHGARLILVFLGAHLLKSSTEFTRVVLSTQTHASHPNYVPENRVLDFDLSYVRLPVNVIYNTYIQPIRLPRVSSPTYVGYRARVSGWGTISDGSSAISEVLKYADVTVITNPECSRSYGNAIKPSKICVATTGGSGPCNGDSGGPLIIQDSDRNYTLVGVVSFGSGRGCSVGAPAVFTRVTSFLQDPFLKNQFNK